MLALGLALVIAAGQGVARAAAPAGPGAAGAVRLPALAHVPGDAAAALQREVLAVSGAEAGAMVSVAADGAVDYLGAAKGHAVPAPAGATPADRARAFVLAHRAAFGFGAAGDLALERSEQAAGRSYHRFQQTLAGVPVLGAEVVVQLDDAAAVEAVMNRAARGAALGAFTPDTLGVLPRAAVAERARAASTAVAGGRGVTLGTPSLAVFVPAQFEGQGPARLAWVVRAIASGGPGSEDLVLDARDGSVVWRFALDADALNRIMSDANSGANRPFTIVRTEGGPLSIVADANSSYDFLGDTWSFYSTTHGRDSYDGAGGQLRGVVRYCGFGQNLTGCSNAQFTVSDTMYVGPGFAVDDVIAHEVTHGVTGATSKLLYQNASGAINESFSDVWGEFVDLGNGRGTDTPAVRWLLGEDLAGGALRNMKNPPQYGHPDKLSSPLYVPAAGTPNLGNDYGGVHTNSGVNNKLCYLLTDGDTFNGQHVDGMGVASVADLYYEAQTHLLTSSSGWSDLYLALRQAAVNLGWSLPDQNNLYRACAAVEIATSTAVFADYTSGCAELGLIVCTPFAGGPYHTLGNAAAQAFPGSTIYLSPVTFHEGLPITIGKLLTITTLGGTATVGP